MATQVASPGTITDDSAVGSLTWLNPSQAGTSDDTYATVAGAATTHYLKGLNCGFTVPTGSTINGITVRIEKKWNSVGVAPVDNIVSLVVGGTVSGSNYAVGTNWPTSDTYSTYGGAADLWGLTPTAADVNGSTFGVVISAKNQSAMGDVASIDHLEITITYTAPKSFQSFKRRMRFWRSR